MNQQEAIVKKKNNAFITDSNFSILRNSKLSSFLLNSEASLVNAGLCELVYLPEFYLRSQNSHIFFLLCIAWSLSRRKQARYNNSSIILPEIVPVAYSLDL